MSFRYILVLLFLLVTGPIHFGFASDEKIPPQVYSGLEYALSLAQSSEDLKTAEFSPLIDFMLRNPVGTSANLEERNGASGAFHSFVINGDLNRIFDYVYNPDIPNYIVFPSSLRGQKWLTPEMIEALRSLPRKVVSEEDIRLLRGQEREGITPDTNTGGYYSYNQNRVVALFPGPSGPVLVSVSIQAGPSEVGKKGCVVGDDRNWNYLYSGVTGLNKTGIGWVDSFMYRANSVLVYVSDSSNNVVRVGSFKWLNAGWAKINMVNSGHILNGIKRFAQDFKTVLEAPGLPNSTVLENKYQELNQLDEQRLREMITPYFEALVSLDSSAVCSRLFKKQLSSGDYLERINREEMVRILLLEYVKATLGKKVLVQKISTPGQPHS